MESTLGSTQAKIIQIPQVQNVTLSAKLPVIGNLNTQVTNKPKHAGGRPTKYNQEMQQRAEEYFNRCYGRIDGKRRIPFIEELALELDVDEDTIVEWKNKKNEVGSPAYPEFSATYSRILLLQKLRLKQTGLTGKNQSFIIFLLNSNHGMISAERQILAGDKQEPLEIIIVEDKKIPLDI